MNDQLASNEFETFCKVINDRMGLHFPPDRWPMLLRNMVSASVDFGFETLHKFLDWVTSTDLSQSQIDVLATHLTISETYFWREPQVFSALTDYVLPELIRNKRKENKCLRIWSAGCSSGEEPYSLAIALRRSIPDISDWDIYILATDINPKALVKAKKGVYSPWSFRNCPKWIIDKYFHHTDISNYEIIPEIAEMVTFQRLNLSELHYPSRAGNTVDMDLIFCRNVLMYFTSEWVEKISANLYQSLLPEGWFVVSSCELSSQVFPQFTTVNFPGAVLYSKTGKKFQNLEEPREFLGISAKPVVSAKADITEFRPANPFLVPDSLPEIIKVIEHSAKEIPAVSLTIAVEKTPTIRLLANQGHLIEALRHCDEAVALDKLNVGLYFLRSSILAELDKVTEAVSSLKQAIYIDPNFIMGHFTLGNLLIGQRKPKMAIRYLQNALDLLNTCSEDDILPESEGLPARYFREIIVANLQSKSLL